MELVEASIDSYTGYFVAIFVFASVACIAVRTDRTTGCEA